LSESGVQGQTHPRLTDRERGRQAKLRKKELDAEKKAKEKDKKQEKVDKDKRAREREAANLRNFFVGPIAIGITPRRDG
jgi:F0F1-type ATP synthase assembly protein I